MHMTHDRMTGVQLYIFLLDHMVIMVVLRWDIAYYLHLFFFPCNSPKEDTVLQTQKTIQVNELRSQ